MGAAYSAGLRYKLACGSVVFMFESKYQEFYYPALEPGVHYISLPEADEETLQTEVFPKMKEAVSSLEVRRGSRGNRVGIRHSGTVACWPRLGLGCPCHLCNEITYNTPWMNFKLTSNCPPMITCQAYGNDVLPPPMGRAARDFVRDQLTPEAFSCYWLKALVMYSQVYFHVPGNDTAISMNFTI